MDSALPEDVAINTFYFHTPNTPADGSSRVAIVAAVRQFYDDVAAGATNSVASYLTPDIDPLSCRIKLYNLTDPQPRTPALDTNLPLTTLGSTDVLPSEVAACMSFRGAPVSGVPAARRRGRVYIGPLNINAADASTGRPELTFMTDVAAAGAAIIALNSALEAVWVVYSPTDDPTPDSSSTGVTIDNGYVDDAWDTQRRRGLRPTARITFP